MNKLKNIYYLSISLSDATYNSRLNVCGVKTISEKDDSSYNNPIRESAQLITDCGKYGYFKGILHDKKIPRYEGPFGNLLDNVKEIDSSSLKDKSFYRTKKLDLPQMKVQNLKDKYDVSIVRNRLAADYVITSKKYLEYLFHYSYKDVHSIKQFTDYIEHISQNISDDVSSELYALKEQMENDDPESLVYIEILYQTWNWKNQVTNIFDKSNGRSPLEKGFTLFYCKDPSMYNVLAEMSKQERLVLDSNLLNICNEDSVVLSPKDCKTISDMINSDDADSASLALEMMANCNIEKSYDKIALIFAFYDHKLRYCSNWNHVNVKSLRKTMDKVNSIDGRSAHGFSFLVKHLHSKNALTEFAIGAITNKMCKTILKYVHLTDDRSVFDLKASDLKLKPAYTVADDLPF